METIYLSLMHTGSWGYLFHEIPSIILIFTFVNLSRNRPRSVVVLLCALQVKANYQLISHLLKQQIMLYNISFQLNFHPNTMYCHKIIMFEWYRISCLLHYIHYLSIPQHTNSWDIKPFWRIPLYNNFFLNIDKKTVFVPAHPPSSLYPDEFGRSSVSTKTQIPFHTVCFMKTVPSVTCELWNKLKSYREGDRKSACRERVSV